jgi:hypothetical protein
MAFTTQKIGRNRTNIFDANGEYVCQLLNKEVAGWLHRAERCAIKDAEWEVERKATRTRIVREYLAQRCARLVGRGVQLELI